MVREAELSDDDIVVLHDPLYPLAPAALVRLVVQALHDHPAAAAAVPVRQVTDTLKRLDEQDVVETTVDRASHRMVFSPQAYRVRALLAALSETGAAAGSTAAGEGDLQVHTLPERVQATGGRLVPVPAPGEVFRVGHRDDLALVEAMVQVGADVDEDPAARPEGVSRGPARS
jgi:2-C-methyl-D-erythritol 4-phosphate cytidylyltransferase